MSELGATKLLEVVILGVEGRRWVGACVDERGGLDESIIWRKPTGRPVTWELEG